MSVKVLHQQSLLDIAIQEYGDLKAVFDIATMNNKSFTDDLKNSEQVIISASVYTDLDIHRFFKRNNLIPATALTEAQSQEINPQGISYWAIGVDFKVS